MCHDCPHKREHEAGDSIVYVVSEDRKPHPCHNAPQLSCIGHQKQLDNIRNNVYQPEDFQEAVMFKGKFVSRLRSVINDGN